jgi:hypothetical protein
MIFWGIHENGQIIAILLIAIYKKAKLLQFCELQFIKKTAKIAKSSNAEFNNYKLSEFRSVFFQHSAIYSTWPL